MARIRSLKPEFFSSPSMAKVDIVTRYFFEGLWMVADDYGRGIANAKTLNGDIFPSDDWPNSQIEDMLHTLASEAVGCLLLYVVGEQGYFQVINWEKHQKIDHPSLSRVPSPSNVAAVEALPTGSRQARETFATDSRQDKDKGLGLGIIDSPLPPSAPAGFGADAPGECGSGDADPPVRKKRADPDAEGKALLAAYRSVRHPGLPAFCASEWQSYRSALRALVADGRKPEHVIKATCAAMRRFTNSDMVNPNSVAKHIERLLEPDKPAGSANGTRAAPAEVPSYHRKAVLPPPSGPQVTHEQIEAARARARPASDAARTGGRP